MDEGGAGPIGGGGAPIERLLCELLARFMATPGASLEQEILRAQQRACEVMGLDRSTLWQIEGEEEGWLAFTQSHGPVVRPTVRGADARSFFPWTLEQVLRGQVVAVSRMADLPPGSGRDRETWRQYETRSTLVFPLSAGTGPVFGALSFDTVHQEIDWPAEMVDRLQLVARVLAGTLVRRRSEQARQAADEALRKSEERLRLAAEAAQFGTIDVDLATGIGHWSPEARRILGVPPGGEMPPWRLEIDRVRQFVHPADAPRVLETLSRAFDPSGSGAVLDEHRVVWPDGSLRWVQFRGQVQFAGESAARRPARLTGMLLDITDRKQTEEDLRQRNQFIETILERAPIGFAVRTADDGVAQFVSARYEEIYACPRGSVTSPRAFFDTAFRYDPELGKRILSRVMADYASGDPARLRWENIPIPLASGDTRYVTATAIAVPGQNLMVTTVQDVTDRVRAEERLRESELRFRQVAESVTDFIWEVDANGLYTYTSPSVERILGYTPEELEGKMHFYDLFEPASREHLKVAALEVFAARQSFRAFANANMSKAGRIVHLETSGVPILDDAGELRGYRGADTDVSDRKRAEELLRRSYAQVEAQKERLQAERDYLQKEVAAEALGLVGQSPAMRQVLSRIEQVGPTHSSVLLTGETGTGKERVAHAIHRLSPRRERLMVTVNCAALPAGLIESELFGHEKGAFTDAFASRVGRFELADGSTLFLDEIGDLPLELQAKLLRVLEEGEFERLGSPKSRRVDVRVVAATNRNLQEEVRQGRFRQDLYYRLNVFPIHILPLREHPEDIPSLVWQFVEHFGHRMGKRIESIPAQAMEQLQRQPWPGNVRELRNVVERAVIMSAGSVLSVDLSAAVGPDGEAAEAEEPLTLEELERRHIKEVLARTGGRIAGRDGAAARLGMKRTTLNSRLKRLGITR